MAIENTYLLGKNITLGCGFDLQAKAPLDSRQTVPAFAGLQALIDGNAAYEGMIVGENPKNDDIAVNPCKEKHLTAIRSAGADEKLLLTPPKIFSLEEALEFITDDELIEVTPKSIRLRKKILNTELRMKEMMRKRRAMEQGK